MPGSERPTWAFSPSREEAQEEEAGIKKRSDFLRAIGAAPLTSSSPHGEARGAWPRGRVRAALPAAPGRGWLAMAQTNSYLRVEPGRVGPSRARFKRSRGGVASRSSALSVTSGRVRRKSPQPGPAQPADQVLLQASQPRSAEPGATSLLLPTSQRQVAGL